MADKWFGKFVEALKKNNLYEDTLILFTTDHGHMLGEHGYIAKNFMHAYNELSHLPLLVKMPRKEHAGEKRKQLTQNIDLMPTILEYHGISIPERVKGKSLLPVIERQEVSREQIIYGWFGRAASEYGDLKFVHLFCNRFPKLVCFFCLAKRKGEKHGGAVEGDLLPFNKAGCVSA